MTKTLNSVTQIDQLLSPTLTDLLRERTKSNLKGLYEDYFSAKPFEQFCREHLGHISIAAKILAYRYFDTDMFRQLYQILVPHAQRIYGEEKFLLHPIFYLRYTFPELAQTDQQKNAFMDSQPHFDRSYGLKAFSFWVALVDINQSTGGLCYFNDPKVLAFFSGGDKNRYSMDGYFENAEQIDPLLKTTVIQPHIAKGSALTFDSDVLHGATKPQTQWRYSFDIRLVPKSEVDHSDARVQRIVNTFHENPTLCNANNLLFLGDYLGAARHFQSLAKISKDPLVHHLSETLLKKSPDPQILKIAAKMQWRDEYCWIN